MLDVKKQFPHSNILTNLIEHLLIKFAFSSNVLFKTSLVFTSFAKNEHRHNKDHHKKRNAFAVCEADCH